MKITDLLSIDAIDVNVVVDSKEKAITHLTELMEKQGNLKDREAYEKDIWKRESLSTTGIGEGIGIPHAQSAAVTKAGLSAMVVKNGVDFKSLDNHPTSLFFMIAVPDDGGSAHLEILQRLSKMLMDTDFRTALINASDAKTFRDLIDQQEAKEMNKEEKAKPTKQEEYELVAVTACPTGIAHTYMAAEALEKMAKELGTTIKVETNGSGGAKNILTQAEIDGAKCVIIAADKNVEMPRFNGKHVIQTKVADGVHKPKQLIEQGLRQDAPVYHGSNSESNDTSSTGGGMHEIYKHLMNGVSHMLPFVIGGGILIALSFLFDDPNIDPSNFGSNTEFAAFLNKVGGAAFGFMMPILAGFIAMSIGDRPALAVGFVGGYLANDGGSGFLGALLAGFIAGYGMRFFRKAAEVLPDALEGLKPMLIYPFIGILAIGAIIIFLVNPPVSALNSAIESGLNSMGGTSKILLGLILGGMMAVDMGGPVNKAAYVFGTGAIASGNYDVMAAVMIGGMVPPLAIAFATIVFKNKFTKNERQTSVTNIIMGLSFITEGAIPFAASDPLHVLPACVLGSATAGALSMFFDCTLMAPHGGLFVIGVIHNPLGYIISLLVGAIVGMIVLGIIKKPVVE